MKKETISFVIPCYNSTNTLALVTEEIKDMMEGQMSSYDYEVILVNDCSPDGTTYSEIKRLSNEDTHIKGINLARNFGQPSAVMAGIKYAVGDYVVCGDDDGQTPFAEFPRLFERILEGYDAVEAKFAKHEKRSLFRILGTKMNEWMAEWLINKPRGIVLTTYWIVKRFVANEMLKYEGPYPYLGGLIMRATRNVCNVEFNKKGRLEGKSGYKLGKLINLWLNGFTSFSVKPLRITAFLGIIVATIGFLFGLVIIVRKILDPTISAGYSSILATMLFLFGVLFLILGVIGEYIGRAYLSLNNEPQSIVKEVVGFEKKVS